MTSIDTRRFPPLFPPPGIHEFPQKLHPRLHTVLGAHPVADLPQDHTRFAVWAPNAAAVAVVGDFNDWDPTETPLFPIENTGIWASVVPGTAPGQHYQFEILTREGSTTRKADPFATRSARQPDRASILHRDRPFPWSDQAWLETRKQSHSPHAPMSTYEVHLGSWHHRTREDIPLYRAIAEPLAAYATQLGFTHVAFLPLTEYPFEGSWGYQVTGYFSPTSRYGSPEDLKFLIDTLHRHQLGVIMDWVPAHFPKDDFGLYRFDGTPLFENACPDAGHHPDWGTAIFDFAKPAVQSFLISSAQAWLERFHFDGIRVDAVASMIYRDYSRSSGQWSPNHEGHHHNLAGIAFLQNLNETLAQNFPDVLRIAEESSAWSGVTRAPAEGGLGFDLKWNLGWMHDTLSYFRQAPEDRPAHHHQLTLPSLYHWDEQFCLVLSHDEVVHEKASLLRKMPGQDPEEQAAHLRALYAWMWAWPGKKLLFMGGEFGQATEWNHEGALDWKLIHRAPHHGLRTLITWLNTCYRAHPALAGTDAKPESFQWIAADEVSSSIYAFTRQAEGNATILLVIANLSSHPRSSFPIGVPAPGTWEIDLCSAWSLFQGSSEAGAKAIPSQPIPHHHQAQSIRLDLPPHSTTYLTLETRPTP